MLDPNSSHLLLMKAIQTEVGSVWGLHTLMPYLLLRPWIVLACKPSKSSRQPTPWTLFLMCWPLLAGIFPCFRQFPTASPTCHWSLELPFPSALHWGVIVSNPNSTRCFEGIKIGLFQFRNDCQIRFERLEIRYLLRFVHSVIAVP